MYPKADRLHLMFYTQSTSKAKQMVFLPQVQILIHYLIHIPLLRIGEMWGNYI